MRTFLISAIAIIVSAVPAGAATRNFGVTSFEKVRIEGPYKVILATGAAPYARANGSAAALDKVAIETRGNILVIHSDLSSWGGYPGQDAGPVEIEIGTHDLSSAWLSGAGTLSIDHIKGLSFDLSSQGAGSIAVGRVDVDQLSVSVIGTASAVLAGRAAKLTALVRGVSSLDASGLAAKDATIAAEGTATVKANISDSATIDGNGPISITLTGRPACTLRVAGTASVSGCK